VHLTDAVPADDSGSGRRAHRTFFEFLPIRHPQEYKKLLRDGTTHRKFGEEVAEELGDVLWYVANVANKFGIDLDEIAEQNLAKTADRWIPPGAGRHLYDDSLPEDQQLPRHFEYGFEHREFNGITKLVLLDCGTGDATGDPLTDNNYEDDGYRFHDVLHLSFAACLGWSPILRKLLRDRQRIVHRTPSATDEVEDGGRAKVIEEAVVAAAYIYADENNFLEGAEAVDWQLLRHIKQMTKHVEVGNRSGWEWNDALLQGFAAWRQLREHEGGRVRGDLLARTIEFLPPAR
jgi:hypothetical protein